MVTTLDRMLFWAFLRSYIFVGVSFISLFVVIDLFTHLDAYVNRPGGVVGDPSAYRSVLSGPPAPDVRFPGGSDYADGSDLYRGLDAAE
jgi:hypothetical protein